MAAYQFESGSYSSWTLGPVVRPPAGVSVDLDALQAEFVAALVKIAASAHTDAWYVYSVDAFMDFVPEARAMVGDLTPSSDYADATVWFALWLAHAKGWSLVEVDRYSLDDMDERLEAGLSEAGGD